MYNFTVILISLLFLTSCDSFPSVSYSLGSADKYVLTGKIPELCSQLSVIAKKHQLEQKVPIRDNTQCYFSTPKNDWVVLGARTLHEHLVVDIQATNSDKEFELVKLDLINLLSTNYAGKYLQIERQ